MKENEKYDLLINKKYTYNPITGDMLNPYGKILKSKNNNGYRSVVLTLENKKNYYILQHRFAWYFINNQLPDIIDHINRIKDDNRIVNLRSITQTQNMWNIDVKGYYWNKHNKKYQVRLSLNNKNIHIGYFDTTEEASKAYKEAKEKYHIVELT